MKQTIMVAGLVIVGMLGVQFGTRLSSDALGMAMGVVFGVLAGVPTALLVLASQRQQSRRPHDDDDDYRAEAQRYLQPPPYQPPVIVLVAPQEQQPQTVNNNTYNDNRQVHVGSTMPLLADREREVQAQRGGRVFRVVGEREEL